MEPKLIDMAERFPQIARRVASDKDWNEDKSNSFKLSVDGENYLCKLKGEAQKSSPREAFYIDCLKGMTVNEFPIYTNALFKGMCPLMMSSIMCYNKKKEDVLVPVKLSTEIGQLEIILTDAGFCAATYQLNVYNCYYANKYLNEDGERTKLSPFFIFMRYVIYHSKLFQNKIEKYEKDGNTDE